LSRGGISPNMAVGKADVVGLITTSRDRALEGWLIEGAGGASRPPQTGGDFTSHFLTTPYRPASRFRNNSILQRLSALWTTSLNFGAATWGVCPDVPIC
jgi:hypothetical protein